MEHKEVKETVNLVFDKLAKFLNHVFPGVVILELFFHKGYFSSAPSTLTEFALYILWAIILSIPYHFIHPFSIEYFYDNLTTKITKEYNVEITNTIDEDVLSNIEDYVELGFILLQLLVTFLLLKLISLYIPFVPFIGISVIVLKLLISMCIAFILGFPIGYVYSLILQKFAIKSLAKRYQWEKKLGNE